MSVPRTPFAVWSGLDPLPVAQAIEFVRRVEAAGYGAFWTREGFGRDPFSLLSAAARETTTLRLGTGIANIYARDPAAMRAAACTLHELSGGRFVLGLGVSHKPWVEDIRGHPYRFPVSAMRSYLEAYGAVPYRVGTPYGAPPIVLAALRAGMLRLAGETADGAFPYLIPIAAIPSIRERLDAAAAVASRPRPTLIAAQVVLLEEDPGRALESARAYLKIYLGLPAYVASLRELGFDQADLQPEPSPHLADLLVLSGDAVSIRRRLAEALTMGADQVAIVPLHADGTVGNIDAVEALAPPW